METVLIAVAMSQRLAFDLKPCHPVVSEATLTLRPKYGVRVIAGRREDHQ